MLPDVTRKRIESEAAKRGVDPTKAIAEAERLAASAPGKDAAATSSAAPDKAYLIGYLPFIKVRELRESIGLPSIPDDELTCGEFARKYGGSPAAAAAATTDGAAA